MKISMRQKIGSAILEVLIAGTILLIGMTGISLLLLRSFGEARDSNMTVLAAQYATKRIQSLTADGTSSLAAADGGVGGGDGGSPVPIIEDPRFSESWTVTNQTSNGVTAFQVDVRVNWRAASGATKLHQVSLVVSEVPDGGTF